MPAAHTSPADAAPPLLDVASLGVTFPARAGLLARNAAPIRAVRGVSFSLAPGETLGLVGESGCGKTTTGRAILGLIPPAHGVEITGRVTFDRTDLFAATKPALQKIRRQIQVIFQDPGGSLNPTQRVRDIVAEPLVVHRVHESRADRDLAVAELLERCGMPAGALNRYPHEFSGGQRQRIAIARALTLRPRLIVCDEPTSALDVSVQAQILNLLKQLQRDLGLAYLFITHDMAVTSHVCDRVAVMREGEIVEIGPREQILTAPEHPYTRSLMDAVPKIPEYATHSDHPA